MTKKFRGAFLVLLAMSALLLLPSCNKEDANKEVTLQLAIFPDLDKAYEEIVNQFMAENPNIKVEMKVQGWGDHHNFLQTAIASGDGVPDVSAVDIGFIGQLGAGGGFVNLLEKDYNAGKYKNDIVDFAWNQASVSANELIGFPVDIGPGCAYYRTDLLEKEGINYEDIKTMDDLFEVGKKISKDLDGDGNPDQWLVADVTDIFQIIIRSDNTRYFDSNGKPVLNRPLVKKAMEVTKKFHDAGLGAGINQWTPEWYAALNDADKGVAYTPSGAWLLGHLKNWMATDRAGDFKIAGLPTLDGKQLYASWGGSFLCISNTSKVKKQAWKLIEYIAANKDNQLKSFVKSATFPTWKDAWNSEEFLQPVEYFGNQNARQIWIDVAKKVPNVFVNEKDTVASGVLTKALQEVLNDEKSIDEALKDAQAEIEKELE